MQHLASFVMPARLRRGVRRTAARAPTGIDELFYQELCDAS